MSIRSGISRIADGRHAQLALDKLRSLKMLLRSRSFSANTRLRWLTIFQRSFRRSSPLHCVPSSRFSGTRRRPSATRRSAARTSVKSQVFVQVLRRIAREQWLLAGGKQVRQCQVDGAHRAMEIDGAEQLRPHAMNRTSASSPRSWIVSPGSLKKL